jgi:hypothetical protein
MYHGMEYRRVELYGWTAEEARGQIIHQLLRAKNAALGCQIR